MTRKYFADFINEWLKSPKPRLLEINAERLFVVGDVHANYELLAGSLRKIPPKSAVVFLGDYNAYTGGMLQELCKFLTEFDLQYFLLRGNHDHPFFWQQEDMRKLVHKHTGVELLGELGTLTWKKKRILTVNGAVSVDRSGLRYDEGRCWPANEGVQVDVVELTQKLVESLGEFDVMLSHTGNSAELPSDNAFVQPYSSRDERLLDDLSRERALVLKTLLVSGAKLWAYGHFHHNHTAEFYGIQTQCLDVCYMAELVLTENDVVELHPL